MKSWVQFPTNKTFSLSSEIAQFHLFFLKFEGLGYVWSLENDKCMPTDTMECAKTVIFMNKYLSYSLPNFADAYRGLAEFDKLHKGYHEILISVEDAKLIKFQIELWVNFFKEWPK